MLYDMPGPWILALSRLDFAFQPIASFADGSAYGYEALLRGWEEAGFHSIADVFDCAFEERLLYAVDLALRRKAFAKFSEAFPGRAKLFYNVDNRLLQMPDYATGNTLIIAAETGLSPSRIVFELSELHEPGGGNGFDRILSAYRSQGFRIALDDFGTGYAGLKLLHRAEPDIVKIDRYFVGEAAADPRKASFLEKIAGMAHLMGITVVAEGIETEVELRLCSDAGCDLAQGFFIARPQLEAKVLAPTYPGVAAAAGRRAAARAGRVDAINMLPILPVALGAQLGEVLDRFRKDPDVSLLPVVGERGEPAGAYRERDFREYVYSPFGISVLEHLATREGPEALLVKAPVAPLGADLARIVELFGASAECGGVILTKEGRYAGILPAKDLLSLVAERELAEARDQNPLTRLPGNLRVAEVCSERIADPGVGVAFAYFDFDNFKPFNDLYGFRNGDRVIMLFSDILKSTISTKRGFIGHLGGDDFFACADADAETLEAFAEASRRFAREAASFYAPEDRERGWIMGMDRGGRRRKMGLLTVSVAIVVLMPGGSIDSEGLSELFAELKKKAKASPEHTALQVVDGNPDDGKAGTVGRAASGDEKASAGTPPPIFTPYLIAAF